MGLKNKSIWPNRNLDSFFFFLTSVIHHSFYIVHYLARAWFLFWSSIQSSVIRLIVCAIKYETYLSFDITHFFSFILLEWKMKKFIWFCGVVCCVIWIMWWKPTSIQVQRFWDGFFYIISCVFANTMISFPDTSSLISHSLVHFMPRCICGILILSVDNILSISNFLLSIQSIGMLSNMFFFFFPFRSSPPLCIEICIIFKIDVKKKHWQINIETRNENEITVQPTIVQVFNAKQGNKMKFIRAGGRERTQEASKITINK